MLQHHVHWQFTSAIRLIKDAWIKLANEGHEHMLLQCIFQDSTSSDCHGFRLMVSAIEISLNICWCLIKRSRSKLCDFYMLLFHGIAIVCTAALMYQPESSLLSSCSHPSNVAFKCFTYKTVIKQGYSIENEDACRSADMNAADNLICLAPDSTSRSNMMHLVKTN